MSVQYEINAEPRTARGTAASRRYRHEGKIPAVIYGAGKDNQDLLLDHNDMIHKLQVEAFHSAIIEVKTDQGVEQAIVRDVQMHPYKAQVMHVDLQRVSATEELHIEVPVHLIGAEEAPGVRLQGGILSQMINEVEIECLPKDLPESLEIDVSALEMHDTVKLSDIQIPEGVTLIALAHGGEDQPVATIAAPKAAEEEEEVEGVEEEVEGEIETGAEEPEGED